MSRTTGLIFGLNVLLAATLIGTISQSSASGTTATLNVTSACADTKTGILRLPSADGCKDSEKAVSFGSPATSQHAVKAAYVNTKTISVLDSCPYTSFVTGVSYSKYNTYNPISTTTSRLWCSTIRVVVP
jgi:hypothetical protein